MGGGEYEWVRPYLVGPTTVRDFCGALLGEKGDELPAWIVPKVAAAEARVRAKMEPGDVLWEWHNPGRDAFSRAGGLAVLRGGVVVWCERHYVS